MSEMVVPDGWTRTSISNLLSSECFFSDGDWVESKDQDPSGENRLLQLADVGDGFFLSKSNRFLNNEQFERLGCTELKQGDILIARMPEPIGRACITPKLKQRCATVVDVAILRVRSADTYWLMSVINSSPFRREIEEHSTGTTRTRIGRKSLSKIEFGAPPLPEQQKIAAILTSVDDVIEKTQAQINKLQDLKKGTMNELLTRGIGHTEFKESPVGLIPVEWEVSSLADVSIKIQDGTHFSPKSKGGNYMYLTSKNIKFGKLRLDNMMYISEQEHADIYRRCAVKHGDVLFTKDGANTGNAALNIIQEEFSMLSSVAFIRCHPSKYSNSFLLQFLLSERTQLEIQYLMSGNAITRMTLEKIKSLRVPVPAISEQHEIASILTSIDTQIDAKEVKVQHAQALKKALMQGLLTGKTRVAI